MDTMRPEIDTIKQAKIPVQGMTCEGCEENIVAALQGVKGIRQVQADGHQGTVTIEYDLQNVTLKEIEDRIIGLGYALKNGLWARIRRSWRHYTEENEREALHAKPAPCCSDDPKAILQKTRH